MIHSLAINNFYSFQDSALVEFTVGKKAGDRQIFLSSSTSLQVNSVTGVFGGNASGKTTLLKAIAFLKFFILSSASENPKETIPVEPFLFQESPQDIPIEFELIFEYAERLYKYELSLTSSRVLSEKLYRKDQRFRYLFERVWNEEYGDYSFKSQDIGVSKHIALRENASFLSSALLQKHEFATYFCAYFDQVYSNIAMHGRTSTHDAELQNVMDASMYYEDNQEFLSLAEKVMSEADLGISKLRIEKLKAITNDGKEDEIPFPVVLHTVNGKNYPMPLFQESRGTQAYYVLLRYILPVLKNGGVAVIDELETSLHSHMVRCIVGLFYSKRTNPNGAQLIASFHTDFLLQDTLEKYQILLCDKNEDTLSSEVWRLDELKGVARNSSNHYAKYHAGAYGGIPNL